MIYTSVLNHMDEDELRNYICWLSKLNEEYQRYTFTLTSAIEKYNDLLHITDELHQCDSDVASRRRSLYALEEEICKKHKDYYIPIPKNSCASVKGEA